MTLLHKLAALEPQGFPVGLPVTLCLLFLNPHNIDNQDNTAFNIAAPASPITGRLMTNHWFNLAITGRGSKGLNDPSGSHGSTLAQYIAKWSNDDEIEGQITRGIAKGMVIDRPNASGWTPLTAASAMGRAKAVEVFAKHYSPTALAQKTTEEYVADYKRSRVVYKTGLDAIGVAQARLDQDKNSPQNDLQKCISILKSSSPHLLRGPRMPE